MQRSKHGFYGMLGVVLREPAIALVTRHLQTHCADVAGIRQQAAGTMLVKGVVLTEDVICSQLHYKSSIRLDNLNVISYSKQALNPYPPP